MRLTAMLRNLGFGATCMHGQLSQSRRLGALNRFKSGARRILIATDVAARGLDIPSVDLVLNFDLAGNPKDHVHRVGRTARGGRAGRAVAFVTQYDVEQYKKIEGALGQRLPAYACKQEEVLVLLERVTEAQRMAAIEVREAAARDKGGRGRKRRAGALEEDDDLKAALSRKKLRDMDGVRKSVKRRRGGGGGRGRKRR